MNRTRSNGIQPMLNYSERKSRSGKASLRSMDHKGSPMPYKSAVNANVNLAQRSVSREPGSNLVNAIESFQVEQERKHSNRPKGSFSKAKDSLEPPRSLPKLKRSKSETFKKSQRELSRYRDAEFGRYKKEPSSKRDSRKPRSTAFLTKQRSEYTFANERFKKSSHSGIRAENGQPRGKFFGVLFFKGKTGDASDAKTQRYRKADRKDSMKYRGELKSKAGNANTRDGKKIVGKQTADKRTKHRSEAKKSKDSTKSRPKTHEERNHKGSRLVTSKSTRMRCQFEISLDKKEAGPAVKVRGKCSPASR